MLCETDLRLFVQFPLLLRSERTAPVEESKGKAEKRNNNHAALIKFSWVLSK